MSVSYEDDLGHDPLESVQPVITELDNAGICGMTRIKGTGFSRDLGVTPGNIQNPEIPKEILMLVVPDAEVAKAVMLIRTAAKSGPKNIAEGGMIDYGNIFVTYVEESFPIRTAGKTGGILKI